jgi:DNA polymerase-3 subunit delta'
MSFLDIYGHERQITIIRKAISQNHIGHAYLFSGIDAIGKRTLAWELAAALNCEKADSLHDACGECPSCRKMQHSSHPDVTVVTAEGQYIRINAIREIQEQIAFKPFEGRWRVIIINDADRMNDQAANALLKTLEEPASSNVLILITARPYALPATVISRCRHMRFNPLSVDTIARFLISRREMEAPKAHLLAGLSGGSIGKALELDQEDIVTCRTEIVQLLDQTRRDDPLSILNLASFFGQDKKEIKQCLDIIKKCFRDALVFKETGKKEMLINQDKSPVIASMAGRLSGEQILRNIFLVEKAVETIEQNVNKTLTLETMAFKLNL